MPMAHCVRRARTGTPLYPSLSAAPPPVTACDFERDDGDVGRKGCPPRLRHEERMKTGFQSPTRHGGRARPPSWGGLGSVQNAAPAAPCRRARSRVRRVRAWERVAGCLAPCTRRERPTYLRTGGAYPRLDDVLNATGAPLCVTFRRVVVSLRGPGQSPVLHFACCVGSLRSVGRCGRCSCWCRPPLGLARQKT